MSFAHVLANTDRYQQARHRAALRADGRRVRRERRTATKGARS